MLNIGHADTLFDKDGRLINPDTEKFLKTFLDAFVKWIGANKQSA